LRPVDGRLVGGVCAAFARHFGLDVTLARIVMIVLTLASCGAALVGYLICWLAIPSE
jgi:phage shock protein C